MPIFDTQFLILAKTGAKGMNRLRDKEINLSVETCRKNSVPFKSSVHFYSPCVCSITHKTLSQQGLQILLFNSGVSFLEERKIATTTMTAHCHSPLPI